MTDKLHNVPNEDNLKRVKADQARRLFTAIMGTDWGSTRQTMNKLQIALTLLSPAGYAMKTKEVKDLFAQGKLPGLGAMKKGFNLNKWVPEGREAITDNFQKFAVGTFGTNIAGVLDVPLIMKTMMNICGKGKDRNAIWLAMNQLIALSMIPYKDAMSVIYYRGKMSKGKGKDDFDRGSKMVPWFNRGEDWPVIIKQCLHPLNLGPLFNYAGILNWMTFRRTGQDHLFHYKSRTGVDKTSFLPSNIAAKVNAVKQCLPKLLNTILFDAANFPTQTIGEAKTKMTAAVTTLGCPMVITPGITARMWTQASIEELERYVESGDVQEILTKYGVADEGFPGKSHLNEYFKGYLSVACTGLIYSDMSLIEQCFDKPPEYQQHIKFDEKSNLVNEARILCVPLQTTRKAEGIQKNTRSFVRQTVGISFGEAMWTHPDNARNYLGFNYEASKSRKSMSQLALEKHAKLEDSKMNGVSIKFRIMTPGTQSTPPTFSIVARNVRPQFKYLLSFADVARYPGVTWSPLPVTMVQADLTGAGSRKGKERKSRWGPETGDASQPKKTQQQSFIDEFANWVQFESGGNIYYYHKGDPEKKGYVKATVEKIIAETIMRNAAGPGGSGENDDDFRMTEDEEGEPL